MCSCYRQAVLKQIMSPPSPLTHFHPVVSPVNFDYKNSKATSGMKETICIGTKSGGTPPSVVSECERELGE